MENRLGPNYAAIIERATSKVNEMATIIEALMGRAHVGREWEPASVQAVQSLRSDFAVLKEILSGRAVPPSYGLQS